MSGLKNGQVTYSHERPPYWEVTAGDGRWWSVAYNPDACRYLIMNRTGRVVDQHGPTGQKVLDVVHKYERTGSSVVSGSGGRGEAGSARQLAGPTAFPPATPGDGRMEP